MEGEELERLRREIEERDELLHFVAHELRNPLHALGLLISAARVQAERAGVAGVVERIGRAERALDEYTRRSVALLDRVHTSSSAFAVRLARFDAAALLRSIASNYREEAEFHGMRLECAADGDCEIESDRSALEHVVVNLLTNALKHSGAKQVRLEWSGTADEFVVDVADDGRGIAPEDQPRVWNKFQRVESGTRAAGSGLGLWIVQRLVHALNGTISLTSGLNGGSRFVLRIPRFPSALLNHD